MFFSVTCRTEYATRLEKGPMRATIALVDEARGLRVAELDLVLRVAGQERDLGAAERLDAAGAVDLVDGEEKAVEREAGLEGQRTGHGQDVADLDLARLGGQDRREPRHADRHPRCPQEPATAEASRSVLMLPPLHVGSSVLLVIGTWLVGTQEMHGQPSIGLRGCQRRLRH